MEIKHLPIVSDFNLWKQAYIQIWTDSMEKKQKLEKVICQTLGIIGDPPAF